MSFIYQFLFLSTLILHATCFPDGSGVDSACSNLTPRHGVSSQTSDAPYTVTFNPTSYKPGQTVTVTITSSSVGFKGFMIQARRADTNQNQELLGSFSGNSATTRQACSGKALVHTNNVPKSSLTFNWIAPTASVGDIRFRVTFVQIQEVFWANRVSNVLVEAIPRTPAALPPITATRPTTDPPTTTATATSNEESTTSLEEEFGCSLYCRKGFNSNNNDCWNCCEDLVIERYGKFPPMNSRYLRAIQFLYGQVRQCMKEFMELSNIRL